MASENSALMNLDEVGVVAREHLLGTQHEFDDRDYDSNDAKAGINPQLSSMDVHAVLVRQMNATPRTAGEIVKWSADATYGPGKAIDALAGDDEKGAGVIAPIGDQTVAQGDFCWIIRKGPAKVQWDGSNNITDENVQLVTAANGQMRPYVAGTDEPTAELGVSMAIKTSGSAGDLVRCLVNFE